MKKTSEAQVILVDRSDRQIGLQTKLDAHREGNLHRAFSVFLFNSRGELLLQQRALDKYHCGGLWSNSCCSHPWPSEDVEAAATRRLFEEMGVECQLTKAFDFIYRAEVGGLIEHEFDHVFVGLYDGPVEPNPREVMSFRWMQESDLRKALHITPEQYTPWLMLALDGAICHFQKFVSS